MKRVRKGEVPADASAGRRHGVARTRLATGTRTPTLRYPGFATRALDHQQNSAENKSAIAGLNFGVRRDQTRIFNLLSSQGFLANAIFAHRADDSFVTKRDVAIAKID